MATRGKQGSQVVQADRALAALAFTLCLCVFNVFQSKLLYIYPLCMELSILKNAIVGKRTGD